MKFILALGFAASLAAQPSISTSELPWAATGRRYDATVETLADARCFTGGGIVVSLVEGELPPGLRLRGEAISGVPDQVGSYNFVLRAFTPCGATTRPLSLVVSGRPILRATPDRLVFEYHTSGPGPDEQNVLVSSTWPSLSYTATKATNAEWLECAPSEGSTPGRGSAHSADVLVIRVKPASLPPGTYEAKVKLTAWQGANVGSVTVVLKVL